MDPGRWTERKRQARRQPMAVRLATLLARDSLASADTGRFRAAIDRADGWLSARRFSRSPTPRCACWRARSSARGQCHRYRRSLELLRQGQSDDGGWGPRASSPPEPFDTALALLALANCDPSPEIRGMIARGRAFLVSPATSRRELDRDDQAPRQRQLCPADLDHRLGDSRPAGNARTVRAKGWRWQTVMSTVLLVTRLEIGPATSTSNGCATLFPARSSSSVPTTRR